MIKKLLPRSLVGQISSIVLLGMILIFYISMQLYSDERQQALNFVSSDSTLERVSSLINILTNTPYDLHDEIIVASQGLGFYLSLDQQAIVAEHDISPLTDKLKQILPADLVQDVRVSAANINVPVQQRTMHHRHESMQARMNNGYNLKLTGSILLSDQHWLNFSSAINEETAQLPFKTMALVIFFTLIILFSMAWTIKRALEPIKALAIAANKVGNERDFKAMPMYGPSEIMPTISAFNQMQSNLATFIDDRSKMLAAISHDLRTPITSLRLRLEFIESSEDQIRMLATLDQMEKMLKATLDFSRDDAQKEQKQDIEVVSLLTTICDSYRDRGIDIKLNSADKLVYRLWPIAFRRVIENIINNSIAYGKDEQGEVHISIDAYIDNQQLKLSLADTGKGIDESKFAEIIKPFVRLDKARGTQDSSVGLGLAISQSIVQAHAGQLSFSNQTTGGLRVDICL